MGRAAGQVRAWLDDQDRPHTDTGDLQDFTATAWDPPCARVFVIVPVTDAVRALAETYAPVVHAWRHLLRPVDPQRLHLAVGWHQAPAAEVTDDQRHQLHDATAAAFTGVLADIEPAVVTVGRPVLTRHGVVLDVSPDRTVWRLVTAMYRAFDTVFGTVSSSVPWSPSAWRPHIPLAYTHTTGPAGALAHDLVHCRDHRGGINRPGDVCGGHHPTPVDMSLSTLQIVDLDLYTPHGPSWTHELVVQPASVSR